MAFISQNLREQIEAADRHRWGYCLTNENNSGIPLTLDHILPISKGGQTTFENVCLACRTCNEFKASRIEAPDPLSGESAALFNPRTHKWGDHFGWSPDGTRVEAFTTTGRATVLALRMNNSTIVAARSRWVGGGWHPPSE